MKFINREEKIYKVSKGWAIIISISAVLLLLLFGFILLMPYIPAMQDDNNPDTYWFMAPMSVIMIVVMIIGLIELKKAEFIISNDRIISNSTFSKMELMFNEIKGYRVDEHYISIEPKDKQQKKIKVSVYFGNTDGIIEWLSAGYPDLDKEKTTEEEQEIMEDKKWGIETGSREQKIKHARLASRILNWTGGLILAWALFYPNPYECVIIACIAWPLVCLVVLKSYKGLIEVNETKAGTNPAIFFAIFMSSIGLCLRSLIDYQIIDYSNVWLPLAVIAVLYISFLLMLAKNFRFKKASDILPVISLILIMAGYAYGVVVCVNCLYDKTKPQIFNATILDKRISTGKMTTYYFEVTSWGTQQEIKEVSVSKSLYNKLGQDDQVNIYFMKGRLNIPWIKVSEFNRQ